MVNLDLQKVGYADVFEMSRASGESFPVGQVLKLISIIISRYECPLLIDVVILNWSW